MRADPKQESRTYLVNDACMSRQAAWPPHEWRCQLSVLLVARRVRYEPTYKNPLLLVLGFVVLRWATDV